MPEFRNSGRGKNLGWGDFTQICNFAAPNNNIFVNRRGFIQQNKSTKHPLSIDVSNIKPLASGHHNFEEAQPLVRVSKDHTSSIYLHYKAHTTLTGFAAKSSKSLVHPWKQLSPVSQNKMDCFFWKTNKQRFVFFSPISGFLFAYFGFFRPGCS